MVKVMVQVVVAIVGLPSSKIRRSNRCNSGSTCTDKSGISSVIVVVVEEVTVMVAIEE